MPITPIQNESFDDAATLAMGEAFDRACRALRNSGSAIAVREIIAKWIIEAAKTGERDPARLYEQALIPFGIEDLSMFAFCVDRNLPIPVHARARVRDPGWAKSSGGATPNYLARTS